MKRFILLWFVGAVSLSACAQDKSAGENETSKTKFEVVKTESEWRSELSPEAFHILREAGTERAFSGKYNDFHESGIFVCAACGNPLFDSKTKFDSGTGWPSFYTVIDEGHVKEVPDHGLGMARVEVLCGRCGGHLGHVFEDGPKPTGLRYCVNSASLDFKSIDKAEKD